VYVSARANYKLAYFAKNASEWCASNTIIKLASNLQCYASMYVCKYVYG